MGPQGMPGYPGPPGLSVCKYVIFEKQKKPSRMGFFHKTLLFFFWLLFGINHQDFFRDPTEGLVEGEGADPAENL